MLGTIIGDIYGHQYELDNIKYRLTKSTDPEDLKDLTMEEIKGRIKLVLRRSKPSDDTICTVGIARAIMEFMDTHEDRINDSAGNEEDFYKLCVSHMTRMGKRYPHAGYGKKFKKWINQKGKKKKPYNSYGNGSAMRVSPVGWYADSLEEAYNIATITALPTHNHKEGIKGAQAVAGAIYLLRTGTSKEELKKYIEDEFGYDLSKSLQEIMPTYEFNDTCQGSIPEAFMAFFEGENFEDVILNAIAVGGDSDTIAAIAGSIAEAYYPIPVWLVKEANDRIFRYTRLNNEEDLRFYPEVILPRKGEDRQYEVLVGMKKHVPKKK